MTAPHIVRGMCRQLYRAIGIPADTERLDDGSWRVSLSTDRVVMVGHYVPTGGGKYRWSKSTLAIDGQPVRNAEDADHLAKIVKDPDAHLAVSAEPAEVENLSGIEERQLSEAPAAVRHAYRELEGQLKEGAQLTVGMLGPQWLIAGQIEDNRLYMTWDMRGEECVRAAKHLRVLIEGEIVTVPTSELTRALAMLMGGTPVESSPGVVGRPLPGARSNSVETRRATVIRN